MKRMVLRLAAIAAAIPLLPMAASGQDCGQAINAVERQLPQVTERDAWNRVQVQLYIAEQFLQKDRPEGCLRAVREARAISGMEAPLPTAAGPSGMTQQDARPSDQEIAQPKDHGPAGPNIIGRDSEGWGTNEAQGNAIPPEQAGSMIGKTVQSPSGEQLGKIADVLGQSDGPQRFVIATGEKRVPIPPSEVRYDKENDIVIANVTREELKDAEALEGGVTTGAHATPQNQ